MKLVWTLVSLTMAGVDYPSSIRAINDESKSIGGTGKQKLGEMGRSFTGTIQATAKDIAVTANRVHNSIDTITDESLQFREESVAASAELSKEAQEGLDILAKEMADLIDLATRTMGEMTDSATEFQTEQQETSKENQKSFNEELSAVSQEIDTSKGELLGTIGETATDSKEEERLIRDAMLETQEEDDEAAEELGGLGDEVADLNDEQKDMILDVSRTQAKAIGRAQRTAAKAKNSIKAQAAKANSQAQKEVNSVLKDIRKDLKGQTKEWLGQADEVADATEEKVDELVDLGREIAADFMSQVTDTRKDNAAVSLDTQAALMEGKAAELDATDEYNTLAQQAKTLREDSNAMLAKEVDGAKQNLQSIKGDLDAEQETASQNLNSDLSVLQDNIKGYTRSEQNRVTDAISQSTDNLGAKVREGTKSIDQSISGLVDSANKLGEVVENNQVELSQMNTKLGSSVETLGKTFESVRDASEEVSKQTQEALENVDGSVNEKLEQVEAQLMKETGRAKVATEALAVGIKSDLSQKIEALKSDAENQLQRSARTIKTATDRGQSVIESMNITAGNIQALKVGINQQLPQARSSVAQSLGVMRTELEGAENTLQAAKTAALDTVTTQDVEMKSAWRAALVESTARIGTQLEASSQRLEAMLRGVAGDVESVKAGSAENLQEMKTFDSTTMKKIRDALMRVKNVGNQESKDSRTLRDRIGKLQGVLNAMTQNVGRNGKMAVAEAEQVLSNGMMENAKANKNAVTTAERVSEGTINKYGQEAVAQLEQTMEGVDNDLAAKGAEAQALDGNIDGAWNNMQQVEAGALGKVKTLEKTVDQLVESEKASAAKSAEVIGAQERQVEASQAQLTAQTENEIVHLEEDATADQDKSTQEAKAAVEQARRDEAQLTRSMGAEMEEAQEKSNARLSAVESEQDGVKSEVESLETGQRQMEKTITAESGALKSKIDIEEDKVKRLESGAKEGTQEAAAETTAEMQGAAQMMGSAKKLVTAELDEVATRWQEKLNQKSGEGKEQAASLTAKVGQFMKSLPDFGGEFVNATGDARLDVEEAHKRIAIAENWTKQVVAGFEGKLEEVRDARETQAQAVHNKASDVKKMVVDEAEKTVDKIAEVSKQTDEMTEEMRKQMGEFRGKLSSLSDVDVDHDKENIEKMQADLFSLQESHGRLMNWEQTSKHRTSAWRDAVEKQMNKLGRSITSDDTDLANERLEQEVSQTNGLRQISNTFQAQEAKASQEEARSYDQLAGKYGEGMAQLAHQKEVNEELEEKADLNAHEALKRKQEAQTKALASVKEQQQKLDQTVTLLGQESKVAAGAMAALKLPLLSVSGQNVETTQQYDGLRNRLNRMAMTGGISLMQTKDQNLRSDTTTQQAEMVDEISAVKALNDELFRQNMKLAQQNSKLEDGLKYAESVPTPNP